MNLQKLKLKHLFLFIKNLFSYSLILLGFILFCFYFYILFIRERLPRDIPFALTEISFYFIFFLCLLYLYLIKQIFMPKLKDNYFLNKLAILGTPFILFDASIKYNKYVYPFYYKIFSLISDFIIYNQVVFIYFFQLIPRIILLSIFMADVFIVHKIEVFYYFIILGLLPLLYRYIEYSLNFALESYTKQLESFYEEVWVLEKNNPYKKGYFYANKDLDRESNSEAIYHDTYISIRKYIEIHFEVFTSNLNIEYFARPIAQDNYYLDYKKKFNKMNQDLTKEDYDIIEEPFNYLIPKLIIIHKFLMLKKTTITLYKIPVIKALIYISYFTCWSYILYNSFHTLKTFELTLKILDILTKYAEIINPFF